MLQESTVSHRAVCTFGEFCKVEKCNRPPAESLARERPMTWLNGVRCLRLKRLRTQRLLHLQNISVPRHHLVEDGVHKKAQEQA